LRRDGLALLGRARFGQWRLTPDWISIRSTGEVAPDTHRPPRFGYDAIRIPLYLVWGGMGTPDRLAAELRFWDAFADKPVPAWVDVVDGSVAPYPVPRGFQAVIDLVRGLRAKAPPPLPTIDNDYDYYSASLTLLAGMARRAAAR
jgi:endoglucanase